MIPRIISIFVLSLPLLAFSQTSDPRVNLMRQADSLYKVKDRKLAIQFVDSLQAIKGQDEDSLLAYSWHRKGVYLQVSAQAQKAPELYQKALKAYKKAIQLREQLHPEGHVDVGYSYRSLGRLYFKRNKPQLGDEALNTAVDLFAQVNRPGEQGQALYSLGNYYEKLQDFQLAADYLLQALVAFRKPDIHSLSPAKNIQWKARTELKYATTLEQVEKLEEAEEHFLQAEEHYQAINSGDVALVYHNLLLVYQKQQKYAQALALAKRSFSFYQRQKDTVSMAKVSINAGIQYKYLEQEAEAKERFELTLTLLGYKERTRFNPLWGPAFDNLGDLAYNSQQYETAAQHYRAAIGCAIPAYWEIRKENPVPLLSDTTYVNGSLADLLVSVGSLARTYSQLFQSSPDPRYQEETLQVFRTADAIIQRMRQEQLSEESRLDWIQKTRALYESAVQFSFQVRDAQHAFFFMERSRTSLLEAVLQEAQAKKQGLIPKERLTKEQSLQQTLRKLEISYQQAEKGKKDSLQTHLAKARTDWKRFVAQLEQDFPAYYQLKHQTTTRSLSDCQDWVGAKTLLSFFTGQDSTWQLMVRKDRVELHKWKSLRASIQEFKTHVATKWQNEQDFAKWQQLGTDLSGQFLPSISDTKGLILLPDGPLMTLPFSVLPVNSAQEGQTDYLIQQQAIQYGYSVHTLLQDPSAKSSPAKSVLAIAPIDFPQLPTLTQSTREVNSLAVFGPVTSLMNEQASLENLLGEIGQHEILHFSTHASAEKSGQQYPWIALADQQWYLPQIYATPTEASLVVLSVCEASEGTYQTGEGPLSLARGFHYAGVPSTIASLWKVEESSTADLMESLYTYLGQGLPKDEALRQAQLQYLANSSKIKSSPYHWAAFIQMGNANPLQNSRRSAALGLLIGGGLLLLSLGFFFLRRRHAS